MIPDPQQRVAKSGGLLPKLRAASTAVSASMALGLLVWATLLSSPSNPTPSLFVVERGAAFRGIARDLQAQGLLRSALAFELLALAKSKRADLRSGEYEFTGSEAATEVLDKLVAGSVKTYSLTLVEGWTLQQTLNALWARDEIERTLSGAEDPALARFALGQPKLLEGSFAPNTYRYARGDTDVDILRQASALLRADLETAWEAREPNSPLQTPYEALILASIVEKETGLSSERHRVAGVFINRLAIGMRLQSDPTTIYGLGEDYEGPLTSDQLRKETPYNTYRIDGLPPTPIAMPGRAALQAVLHPEHHDFLYFVADGMGGHVFSVTLTEHNAAVENYRATLTHEQ